MRRVQFIRSPSGSARVVKRARLTAESSHSINVKRDVPVNPHARRPVTRIAFGILVAFAYAGILAGAGFFISGAVNSMNESPAVARATIDALRETPRADAAPPASGSSDTASVATVPPAAELARSPAVPAAAAPASPSVAAPVSPPVAALAPPVTRNPPRPRRQKPRSNPPPSPIRGMMRPLRRPHRMAPAALPPQAASASASEFEARGDERLDQGDVASARLFYERAADEGNARAARRLGNSFDPAFLARWGVRFMRGDPAEAARWYRRAGALGDGEAAQDLAALLHH